MKFTKMHGLGNDFIVIDGINQSFRWNKHQIKSLADRHLGIGFDQLLLVEPSSTENCDFNYRIFNADGSEVGQCGNGARCLARFIQLKQLSNKSLIRVATTSQTLQLRLNEDESVTVYLPPPDFSPQAIPLSVASQQDEYQVFIEDECISFHAVSVGNPHAVIRVDDCNNAPVTRIGSALCHHPLFTQQANIGFMQIINAQKIKLRVFERGVGETLACGSGALAAAVCSIAFHQGASQMEVCLKGGDLTVEWLGDDNSLLLTGEAVFVYEGEINLCE